MSSSHTPASPTEGLVFTISRLLAGTENRAGGKKK